MVSSGDNIAWATLGDEIELTFESSEALNNPTVCYNGMVLQME